MGKLGKRARKFSRKNLQSVDRKKRKFNSMRENSRRNKRRNSDDGVTPESNENVAVDQPREEVDGTSLNGTASGNFLDAFLSEEEGSSIEDASESDGYLSEDSDCPYISDSSDTQELQDGEDQPTVVGKKEEMLLEIAEKREKIERLREEDADFSKFLDSRKHDLKQHRSEDASSDEEGEVEGKEGGSGTKQVKHFQGKTLTTGTIDVWLWMAMEEGEKMLALPNLLNAFRAACHFGNEDVGGSSRMRIPNKEVYSKIITCVLCEADGIFRRLLGLSGSKVTVQKISSSSKWVAVRPLMKSYLRSSVFLLKQLTDNQLLAFALSKLRASLILFSAFPSLFRKLIKTAVQLWATGDKDLSSSSYSILNYVSSNLSSEWLDACLTLTYRAFTYRCKFVDPASFKQIEFLSDCLVELYSLDIQCSYQRAISALQQLTRALQSCLKTKNKEELRRIHSWQYLICLDVWVKFIVKNVKVHNLKPLLFSVIQIVMGIAHLFPGCRYIPLRIKCVRMLNQLSSASGIFVPIVFLLLDSLECSGSGISELGRRRTCSFSSVLKVPKQLLKTAEFEEECIVSAIEQLSAHLAQWSCCISFPELVAVPLIAMKRFLDESRVESCRRLVRRFVDQIEQNRDFVERKRDEVSFSPNDHASAESFLQFEKSSGSAPFSLNARSIQNRSISRKGGPTSSRS